jgi:hypothetical protein
MSADELPGWRETTAKQSIVEFVAAVTDLDSPDFIPERDRIAVFDNDGTLWTEKPVYAQLVFALDRAAELGHPTSLEELHAGGMEALIKLLALTHAGITTDEFDAVCRSWLASARHPRFGRPYPATGSARSWPPGTPTATWPCSSGPQPARTGPWNWSSTTPTATGSTPTTVTRSWVVARARSSPPPLSTSGP